ncbi:hypothetical protein HK100_004331, partial [Physocladia obscura]
MSFAKPETVHVDEEETTVDVDGNPIGAGGSSGGTAPVEGSGSGSGNIRGDVVNSSPINTNPAQAQSYSQTHAQQSQVHQLPPRRVSIDYNSATTSAPQYGNNSSISNTPPPKRYRDASPDGN